MAEGALAALVTATVRASMAVQAEGTDAIAAGVTDVPGPVLGELSSTTLTRNQHKLYLFKLVTCCYKDRYFPSYFQKCEGIIVAGTEKFTLYRP